MQTTIQQPVKQRIGQNINYLQTQILERDLLERYGVTFDENGEPMWYNHKEIFGDLAQKLLSHYGEEIREPLNQSLINHSLPTL